MVIAVAHDSQTGVNVKLMLNPLLVRVPHNLHGFIVKDLLGS